MYSIQASTDLKPLHFLFDNVRTETFPQNENKRDLMSNPCTFLCKSDFYFLPHCVSQAPKPDTHKL